MTFNKDLFVLASVEYRNAGASGTHVYGGSNTLGSSVAWGNCTFIKSGIVKAHATHFYLNNANPNTVSVVINNVTQLECIFPSTTGLITIYEDFAFSAGDTICLKSVENSVTTIIRGYSFAIGVYS